MGTEQALVPIICGVSMRGELIRSSLGAAMTPRIPNPLEFPWLWSYRNGGAALGEAGGLFEGVGQLQDAEVLVVAADDLDAYG